MRYQIRAWRNNADQSEQILADVEDLEVAGQVLAALATGYSDHLHNFMLIDRRDMEASDLGIEDGAIIAVVNPYPNVTYV